MDKLILTEFLGQSTDFAVTLNNLEALADHINQLPIGNITMPTLVHIQKAITALKGLEEAME